jgi:L-ribulose-5-phosphate 4-epimerase
MVAESEGIIKYRLKHQQIPLADPGGLDAINDSRQVLYEAGLIGQTAGRYDGLGYGNLSCRVGKSSSFVISGSQTGLLPVLRADHYVLVTDYDRSSNTLTSQGLIKPSSESATHACFYLLSDAVGAVIHVHSPSLWRYCVQSGMPATAESTPYGSQQLLAEIECLWQQRAFAKCHLLVMLGHEDGIICFGESLQEAMAELMMHWRQCM